MGSVAGERDRGWVLAVRDDPVRLHLACDAQLTPGVLTPNQTYAVIAYILHRNGVVAADAEMDAQTLPAVIMPARDRFVVDDRQGGSQIR